MKSNIIILGLASVALSACTDSFLDTTSKTSLNTTVFYKTESQAESAVVGCYDQYQRTVSNGSWPTLYQAAETMGDDCFGGGSSGDMSNRLLDRMDCTVKNDETNIFGGIWTDYYKCIYNCNLLLTQLDNIGWTSTDDRATIEGQARAIRGLAYFDLVRMFENVPLLTTPTRDIVPQANPDDVYKQIVEDLKYAADNIPANKFTDNSATLGRISRYAAAAMLARVYLFYDGVYNDNQGKTMPGEFGKADALNYCETVIKSGIYSLENNFADLWPGASTQKSAKELGRKTTYKEDSKEILWVVKFNNDQNWSNTNYNGNRFIINIGMPSLSVAPYNFGWGACPITPYAHSLFSNDDTRGESTIINTRNLIDDNGNTAYSQQISNDVADFTGYTIKKYAPLCFADGTSMPVAESDVTGANFMTSQDQDWILLRYADVLLMAAELGSQNAAKYYNEVVDRAYKNHDHDVSTTPGRELIWQERRKEFMGEGVRYFDLRRQGLDAFVKAIAGQACDNGLAAGTPSEVYTNKQKTTIADSFKEQNIREKRGFWQIPSSEISLSGNTYKQNAGW